MFSFISFKGNYFLKLLIIDSSIFCSLVASKQKNFGRKIAKKRKFLEKLIRSTKLGFFAWKLMEPQESLNK